MPGLLDALMFQNSPLADQPMVGGMLSQLPGPISFRDRFAPMTNAQEYGTATAGPAGPAGSIASLLHGMPGAAMPPNASPTVGMTPPATPAAPPASPDITAPQPDVPETSLLGRMGNFLSNNQQMLMRMAAGFAGAPTLGAGMSRAFSGGAEGAKDDRQQQGLAQAYQAMVKAGVPPAQAMAAIAAQQGGNPAMLNALAGKHFGAHNLMNVEGQLRNPLTGEIVGQGPGQVVTIKDPTSGLDVSAMKYPDGRIERVSPQNLPNAGQAPVQVQRVEDALRLPPGTPFIDPYGMTRVR